MRQPIARPSGQDKRRWLPVLLTLCWVTAPSVAGARQEPPSGAVETFEPEYDAGFEQRPRAGLYGITELMMAALHADVPKARRLIDQGADVNETDNARSTPLMWAVLSGDVGIVEFLIAEGADVRAKAYGRATALMNAISAKDEAIAVVLIDAGADPNGRGNSSRNFLESAAESGMAGVVEALIRNGADVATYGPSALTYAVARGHRDAALVLLDAGVDANSAAATSKKSILYTAAETGDLDLVRLLISRGANVHTPDGFRSPLYPAAARRQSAMAELLADNGAVVTGELVLFAVQKRSADTAIALLDRLDLEELGRNDVKRLLEAADDLGNAAFRQRLLEFPSVKSIHDEAARQLEIQKQAARRKHSRLLYARQVDDRCVVGIWDSRSGLSRELADMAACPDDISVSADRRSAFIVDGTALRIVSTDQSAPDEEVPLPNLDYRAWLDRMTLRPDQYPDYQPATTAMRPLGIGSLEDGSLGLLLGLSMPADDQFEYLLRRSGSGWSMTEARWCDRWGCEDALGSLAIRSTNVWNWPESRMVWHPDIASNPYFRGQSVEMVDLEYENYQAANHRREFEIDGVRSILRAYTRPGEHSDTSHTLGISLSIDGGPPIELAGNQCLSSIVGRFVLVTEFFGGRFEVTDLGTGETVIADLKLAMWLD